MIEHVEAVAKKKMNIPGWEPYAWELIGTDGMLVTGGIPRLLKSGPRKGEKTWDGKGSQVVVVKAEIDQEVLRYELETGKCAECMGEGKRPAGWSEETGPRFKPCEKCAGSGVAA